MIDLKLTAGGEDTAATALAEFSPRPKRKYTVTERVLAASRANLERANAVPREIRYRPTEKRRRACHRNLTLAVIAKKRDRSPRYATCFRNGWYVADPERALPLVGATPEEYHQHLDAWRREILPRDATEEKLAHALGMLSWRRIAGVRLECDLETLRVYRLLDALAAERSGTATPGGAIEASHLPAAPLSAERFSQLGYDLEAAFSTWEELITPLERIRDRMLGLWQELLRGRGEPLIDLPGIGCFGRQHPVVIDHEAHSAYGLAGPFASGSRTEATLSTRPASLAPAEQWKPARPPAAHPGSLDHRGLAGSQPATDEGDAFSYDVPASDAALLREARQKGWDLPGDFASFLQRVQAAIGVDEPRGEDTAATAGGETGAMAAWKRWMKRVRMFARALWNHLTALRRHADRLLGIFTERLGDRAVSLWPEGTRRPQLTARQTLDREIANLDEEPDADTERRGEDLAQFYHDSVVKLVDEMHFRWRRCRAAFQMVKMGVGRRE